MTPLTSDAEWRSAINHNCLRLIPMHQLWVWRSGRGEPACSFFRDPPRSRAGSSPQSRWRICGGQKHARSIRLRRCALDRGANRRQQPDAAAQVVSPGQPVPPHQRARPAGAGEQSCSESGALNRRPTWRSCPPTFGASPNPNGISTPAPPCQYDLRHLPLINQ